MYPVCATVRDYTVGIALLHSVTNYFACVTTINYTARDLVRNWTVMWWRTASTVTRNELQAHFP